MSNALKSHLPNVLRVIGYVALLYAPQIAVALLVIGEIVAMLEG